MRIVNKSSVIGFILGAVLGPIVAIGGFYLYIQHQLADLPEMVYGPPDIPGNERVTLDWNIERLDKTTINLGSEFKGAVLFLNFWATWCPPCVIEMPSIEKLYKRFDQRVEFICVSGEEIETIKSFRKKEGYTFPMYHIAGDVPKEFHTDGIPATFILSNGGKLLLKQVGGADWSHESVVNFLEEILKRGAAQVRGRDTARLVAGQPGRFTLKETFKK